DKDHSLYFINNTDGEVVYSVSEEFGDHSLTLSAGLSAAKSTHKLDEKSIAKFEEWPALRFQFIPLNRKVEKIRAAFEKRVKFKASAFFKSRGQIPVLEKEGYLFQIDTQEKPLDLTQLNRDLNEEKEPGKLQEQFRRPEKEIDLHIEKLTKGHD